MHKRGKLWGLWLGPLIGGLALASVAHRLAAPSDPATLAKKAAIVVGELRSLSAEGRFLAEEGQRGTVTRVFLREHASQIAKDLHSPLDRLRRGEWHASQAWTQAGIDSGARSLAALQELADVDGSSPALQRAAAALGASAGELSRLEQSLEQRSR